MVAKWGVNNSAKCCVAVVVPASSFYNFHQRKWAGAAICHSTNNRYRNSRVYNCSSCSSHHSKEGSWVGKNSCKQEEIGCKKEKFEEIIIKFHGDMIELLEFVASSICPLMGWAMRVRVRGIWGWKEEGGCML
jgi:hypothetical protein